MYELRVALPPPMEEVNWQDLPMSATVVSYVEVVARKTNKVADRDRMAAGHTWHVSCSAWKRQYDVWVQPPRRSMDDPWRAYPMAGADSPCLRAATEQQVVAAAVTYFDHLEREST